MHSLWEQYVFRPAYKSILVEMGAVWSIAGRLAYHQDPMLDAHRCMIRHKALHRRGNRQCIECQLTFTDVVLRDNQELYCTGGVPVPGVVGCG